MCEVSGGKKNNLKPMNANKKCIKQKKTFNFTFYIVKTN